MPSQPQATLQATSVPMKLFQPERNYTQNVRKTHLLICDGIACNKAGSLTSLGSISAHICVSSIISLHQVRLQKTSALHTCAHLSQPAGAQRSLNIFSSSPYLREAHHLVSLCESFYLALILSTYGEHQDKQPTVYLLHLCICCSLPSWPTQHLVFLSTTTRFSVSEIPFMISGVIPRYIHHALLNSPFLVCLLQTEELATFLPLKH